MSRFSRENNVTRGHNAGVFLLIRNKAKSLLETHELLGAALSGIVVKAVTDAFHRVSPRGALLTSPRKPTSKSVDENEVYMKNMELISQAYDKDEDVAFDFSDLDTKELQDKYKDI